MNFERCKRRLKSDKSGVSEVVGNILILMITVILFSAIAVYVNQIPMPEATTKADFVATVSFEIGDPTIASLTVTHAGGMLLQAEDTAVVIETDNTSQFFRLSEDEDFPHSVWKTGTDWTKSFSVVALSSNIIVTVVDLEKSSAVWTTQVSGGAGGTPPIILQRYVDSEIGSPSPDPVKMNDTFSLFVKVIDLDNDLSATGVWLDVSELPGTPDGVVDNVTDDGWYRFDFSDITNDVTTIDGALIKIHAMDDAGHETVSSYRLSVTILPTDINYYERTMDFEGGLPSYITWMSDGQGFGMYAEDGTSGDADVTNATSSFIKDEMVFIRVASLRLTNIAGMNSMTLVDTRTGYSYVPQYNLTLCSSTSPFYPYTSSGGAWIYESQFNTTGLPPSAYSVVISLKSSTTNVVFQTVTTMVLSEEGSPITFTPRIWTYNEDGFDWGTKAHPYDVTGGANSVVYVSVEVQDAVGVPAPSVDDIRIVDMKGDTQLHGSPPSGSMLSSWTAVTTPVNNQTYAFTISLRFNNGDQWLGGTHAYTLKISRFSDANEGVYSLSTMIYVRAATARADFFVGAAGYMTGTSNFIDPQYLFQIQNNNFFTQRVLYDYANAPSAADNYAISALALGDIDGDGDKDILMGQYRSHKLYYIENSLNTFGSWQDASVIARPLGDDGTDINWIACGDINGDGDIDFAYSTMDGNVVIMNNSYGATGHIWKDYGTTNDGVRKIDMQDMTGDERADLIVLGNGRVYVYDLLDWDSASPIATLPESGSSNILDFDIADVNGDARPDILTVDATSGSELAGVYVSYYHDNPSPDEKWLSGTIAYPSAGQVVSGLIDNTRARDGSALIVRENLTSEDYPQGRLSLNITMDTLTAELDQTMQVTAKVSADATEGFYVWYSTTGVIYTPLIYIPPSATDYTDFIVHLPQTVAGQAMTLRFTDTINTLASGTPAETLYIDYVAVLTDYYGGYVPIDSPIVDRTQNYECVRAGNLNGITEPGDLGLEVVVARDSGTWMAYNRTSASPETWTALAGWTDSDPTFYCRGNGEIDLHSSMSNDENPVKAILSGSSPRLFHVVDVNGDGYSDVVVVNTTVNSDLTSQIALYLNMEPSTEHWWYYVVKDIAAEFNTVDVRGGMTYLLVDNLIAT